MGTAAGLSSNGWSSLGATPRPLSSPCADALRHGCRRIEESFRAGVDARGRDGARCACGWRSSTRRNVVRQPAGDPLLGREGAGRPLPAGTGPAALPPRARLLRLGLAEWLDLPAERLRFGYGAEGKPHLRYPDIGLQSNSGPPDDNPPKSEGFHDSLVCGGLPGMGYSARTSDPQLVDWEHIRLGSYAVRPPWVAATGRSDLKKLAFSATVGRWRSI